MNVSIVHRPDRFPIKREVLSITFETSERGNPVLLSGCGTVRIELHPAEMASFVASQAPYSASARAEFFRTLREYADRLHPTED